MRVNRKDILRLFNVKSPEIKGHITSILSVIGEDLGAALFKHYCENTLKRKTKIYSQEPKTGNKKGPRLDRWICVDRKGEYIAYQTEIKSWSVYAVDKYSKINEANVVELAAETWERRVIELRKRKINKENKVLFPMKTPPELSDCKRIEPLIIYWYALSKNRKDLKPLSQINVKQKRLNIFSMFNYLNAINDVWLTLDMPGAQKRIILLKKYFK